MERRTFLSGVGSAVAVSGGAVGVGAFGTSNAYGTAPVDLEGEDVVIRDPETGAPMSGVRVTGAIRPHRVNIKPAVFELDRAEEADADAYDVQLVLVDGSGEPLSNLERAFDQGLIDLRVFAVTGPDSVTFLGRKAPRQHLRDEEGQAPAPAEFLDSDRATRSYVPDVGSAADTGHGSVTIADGEPTRCGMLVTVGDSDGVTLPDFRVDVSAAGE